MEKVKVNTEFQSRLDISQDSSYSSVKSTNSQEEEKSLSARTQSIVRESKSHVSQYRWQPVFETPWIQLKRKQFTFRPNRHQDRKQGSRLPKPKAYRVYP